MIFPTSFLTKKKSNFWFCKCRFPCQPPFCRTVGGSHRRSFSIACEEGNVEMAKLLLNHDESQAENEMNFVDDRGRNTLHYACKSKSLPMVKFAMANLSSIAVNARDHSGNTPYAFARRSGNLRIVNFLAKYKAHL